MMRDHVGTEADQHLRSGLSADPAIQIRLAWEELAAIQLAPTIGNGIAHEYNGRTADGGVVGAIPAQVRPILQETFMPSFREFIDPGGRLLARRLDELCSHLEDLSVRLRGTIANAIGETIGGVVRDAALGVINTLTGCLPHIARSASDRRQGYQKQ